MRCAAGAPARHRGQRYRPVARTRPPMDATTGTWRRRATRPRRAAAIDLGPHQAAPAGSSLARPRARRRNAAIDLDELEGSAGSDQPLRLALRGRLPRAAPYRLRVNGGSAAASAGRQPNPGRFRSHFKAAGARLHATGELDARQGEARLRFDADADDLAQAGRSAGGRLPQAGAAALSGAVVARPMPSRSASCRAGWASPSSRGSWCWVSAALASA